MWLIIQSKIRQEERVRDESERVNEKNQVTQADPKQKISCYCGHNLGKIQSVCPYRTLGTFIVHGLKFKFFVYENKSIFYIVQATCLVFIEC